MAQSVPMAMAKGNLDHIYFFANSQSTPTSSDQPNAYPEISPESAPHDSASHRSDSPSGGSSDGTDSTTATTSSGSGGLNPRADAFTPKTEVLVTPQPIASQSYELRKIDGMGYGLVATTLIPIGTRIICEAPLLRIPQNSVHLAWGPYCRLSNSQKGAFDRLHFFRSEHLNLEQASRMHLLDPNDDSLDDEDVEELVADQIRVMGTFAVNNFQCGPQGLGVFETSARLNHSCVPNVHHSYNPTLGKQTVHAARDIQPGEELVTTYLGGNGTYLVRAQRLEMLRGSYGFTCQCLSCSDKTGQSDHRRELLANLVWGLQQFLEGHHQNGQIIPASPLIALQQAESVIHLMIEESLFTTELMKAYRTASTQALYLKDFHKAMQYAHDEAEVERNTLGAELDDIRRIGAASADWIAHVRRVAQSAGVSLEKWGGSTRKKKQKNKVKREKKLYQKKRAEGTAAAAAAAAVGRTPAQEAQEALRVKREGERVAREAERVAREEERRKREYESSWPGLK